MLNVHCCNPAFHRPLERWEDGELQTELQTYMVGVGLEKDRIEQSTLHSIQSLLFYSDEIVLFDLYRIGAGLDEEIWKSQMRFSKVN